MQAELRRLHSPDAPNLDAFMPPDPEHFGILVQAMIGPKAGPGEESFDFMICSPRWLEEKAEERGFVIGRHHLVINRFDIELVRELIRDLCARAAGPDWASVARYIARFGKWEFEDYRETELI
jgi:hypothetical protein